ncbi:MAG TPA: gamma-glutamyltransferase [Cyanobacteria bacterium UBA8803]|nr:gamma-glutamyltransferase [Cyanobacteria bacterium UBA9273]HBL58111.1 gamma-glutamyltransferase [Cyanobacteria bacterium UBA8803]
MRFRLPLGYRFLVLVLSATLVSPLVALTQDRRAPEAGSGWIDREAVLTQRDMAVSANPLASEAGREILRRGGSAVDAAITIQLVLGLVEPQSSGLGGGGFLVYYDAKTKEVRTYDGRETAPTAAQGDRFLGSDGKPLKFEDAVVGGKSVGVPGTVRMLEMVHKNYGKLPWSQLFQPAIQLAEQGFPISPRLHALLSKEIFLPRFEPARSYFYQPDGTPKPVGTKLVNKPYAEVLRQIARRGADAFYKGRIARDIVDTVTKAAVPGDITTADLANYQAKEREPICGVYRVYKVCSMGAPSSGGMTVLQMLGMLERFNLAALKPNSLEAIHLFSEAGRLAYADRGLYMADADFMPVPTDELIDPEYLQHRAMLIDPKRAMSEAKPGKLSSQQTQNWGEDDAREFPSTSHLAIVDRFGNAVSLTSSIEDAFGSRLMVRGFLLNNQLTDFSFSPTVDGKPVANRVEPGKRPRSSMAPTMVFDRNGKLVMVVGSAGGSNIINYVTKTLVGVLDWKLDSQQAVSLPNFGNRNGPTELEAGTTITELKPALEAMGHSVQVVQLTSGLGAIVLSDRGLVGGADPRREGAALGY